jgi:hypothetical protein
VSGPNPKLMGALVTVALVFGSAVLIAQSV